MSGLITVFKKELADNFSSKRFLILFALVLFAGIFAIYIAAGSIKEAVNDVDTASYYYITAPDPLRFIFLKLFTVSSAPLPSFLTFIAFFVPIVGIALGFDAINNEKNTGTLSRLLAQPIFRDVVINGKFLAGLTTIAIMLVSIVMLVAGVGLRLIGVPPSSEEIIRLIAFLVASIVYGAFWLGLAMLFSIFFRHVTTSALASIAIWIFFIFFMAMLSGLIANMIVPVSTDSSTLIQIHNAEVNLTISRLSPIYLFEEAVAALLEPGLTTLGFVSTDVAQYMLPTTLSVGQSLLVVWPHLVSMVWLTAICFAISYIRFMREEIRST